MAKAPPGPIFILRGHEGCVTALHFVKSVDLPHAIPEKSLISGSDVGEIFFWNLQTFRLHHKLKAHGGKMILSLNFNEKLLFSQGKDGIINIWSFSNDWEIFCSINTLNMGFCASALLFDNDKSLLISASQENSGLTIYDYLTGESATHLKTDSPHLGMCMCIKVFQRRFSTEWRNFIIGGYENGSLQLWDADKSTIISSICCHNEPVMCLDYDQNFKSMGISGSVENTLQLWKISEELELQKDKLITVTNAGINCVKIREDGKLVLVAGLDGNIRVFSWKTMKPLAVLTFHTGPIQSLQCYKETVSNKRSIFASGGKDKNVVLWSLY